MASPLDALSKIPTSRKILVGAFFVVVIGAMYYLLFYKDLVDKAKKQEEDIEAVEALRRQAHAEYVDYQRLSGEVEAAREALKELNRILPQDRDVEGLMLRISEQAKTARIRLSNIIPQDEEEAEYYVKIPIRLEFRGTFHQIVRFFYLIETSVDRLVNMENIELARAPTDEEPGLLKGNVLATTFMAKEIGSEQAAPTP
jgi:type IV pilus assembly protein PilO